MQRVVIFGAGGLGRLVATLLEDAQLAHPIAFLDSNPALCGTTVQGLPVLGSLAAVPALIANGSDRFIVAIGEPRARIDVATRLRALGANLISAIHPQACIASSAHLGRHLIIGPRSTICVNSSIGDDSIILAGAIVEHDNQLGRGVVLHPAVRLAGGVTIGDCAVLGIGACVIPGRRIEADAVVEPGAVVIRNAVPGTRAIGAPQVRPAPISRSAPSSFIVA